jgi:NADH dehydrogenase
VEVLTGCKVTAIDEAGITLEREGRAERLEARTVLWAAGVGAVPLGRRIAAATGVTLDRAGRVPVQGDLSVAGHPELFVVGDLAAARSEGQPVPGVSPAAKQMGAWAADNIVRRLRGQTTRPFSYADYGTLATIGRNSAVVQMSAPWLGAVRLTGYPAWLFWLFAHVFFLIGFRNRLIVLFHWAWSYWTFDRHARVVAQPETRAQPAAAPPARSGADS